MRKNPKSLGEKIVKDIKRATRKYSSSEETNRMVLDGLRGDDSIAELCRRKAAGRGHGPWPVWTCRVLVPPQVLVLRNYVRPFRRYP